MDALGFAGPARHVVVVGKGKSSLDAYLDRALATQKRVASRASRPPKKGSTTDPIISAWRSTACRCSISTAATIW